jgi:hypothetical protein
VRARRAGQRGGAPKCRRRVGHIAPSAQREAEIEPGAERVRIDIRSDSRVAFRGRDIIKRQMYRRAIGQDRRLLWKRIEQRVVVAQCRLQIAALMRLKRAFEQAAFLVRHALQREAVRIEGRRVDVRRFAADNLADELAGRGRHRHAEHAVTGRHHQIFHARWTAEQW